MSDLNDFFAKKDRKKKRAGLKAKEPAPIEPVKIPEVEVEPVPPPPPKQPDDGWIEIDDPRGAQVNTGGRTIVEFKRDAEDKELITESNEQSEKFSGWIKSQGEQQDDEHTDPKPGAQTSAGAAFPTLADTANAPKVPASSRRPTSSDKPSPYASAPGRPRFINSSKLQDKLANRGQAPSK